MTQIDRNMGLVGNVAMKAPCMVATTAPITTNGLQTIDGVALATGDRVLRKDEVNTVLNGIWEVDSGDWNRSQDFDGPLDAVQGTIVYVTSGTVGGNVFYQVTSAGAPTPGSDNIAFSNVNMTLAGVSAYMQTLLPAATAAVARGTLGAAASGIDTSSGITMNTGKLVGRTTGGVGALEDISIGAGLTLAAGSLSASGAQKTPGPINHGLAAPTYNAGAATIAIKDSTGADPTAGSAIDLYFQSETVTTGTVTDHQVTAAASVVIPSGATMGTVSAKASRIYIGYLWDGTHLEPCCWNPVIRDANGYVTGLFRPDQGSTYATTLLDAAADSAGVIYSATARTGCRILMIGYFDSVQTTAGTWAQAADKLTVIGPQTPVTGARLQRTITRVTAATFNTASTTYVDITGLTLTISPSSKSNLIEFTAYPVIGGSAIGRYHLKMVGNGVDLMVGDAASTRLPSQADVSVSGAVEMTTVPMNALDAPGSTAALTYKIQIATDGSTTYLNRTSTDTDGVTFGRAASNISAEEICA